MKNKLYILSKVLKNNAIPLLIFSMAMVLFFVGLSNRNIVYASEQIASIQLNVYNTCDGVSNCIASDSRMVSSAETTITGFADVDCELTAFSKIEMCYTINNITSNNCAVNLNLNRYEMQNIKVEYFVNNEQGELTSLNGFVEAGKTLEIKVVIYVDNVASNAVLGGSLSLVLTSLGE